jgi:AcrR family transcriptional regulator
MATRKKPDVSLRKTPNQARSVDTMEALLRATAHILEKEGYDRLTTNRVAEKAGVSIGSLYQYFPNKDALVLAVGERHFDEMRALLHERLARKVAPAGLAETVGDVVAVLVATHTKNPRLHAALTERVLRVGLLQRRAAHLAEDIYRPLLAYVAAHPEEISVEDPEMAVFVLTHAVEATIHAFVLGDAVSPSGEARLVATLTTMIVRFIEKNEKKSPLPSGGPPFTAHHPRRLR